jgi:Tripartite ATP-independent periplasmic transporter, DctM component
MSVVAIWQQKASCRECIPLAMKASDGARAVGLDLIWFGVVMTIVMEMGLIPPPVGPRYTAARRDLRRAPFRRPDDDLDRFTRHLKSR